MDGFLDKAKEKAAELVDQHADTIDQGIAKATAMADERTGGKYSEQIDTAATKVREGLDTLDGQADDFGGAPAQP